MLLSRIDTIAQYLILSFGWGRLALACLLGAIAALAQAPFHLFPAMIVAFSGLVWILDGAVSDQIGRSNTKTAFGIGWAFGLGYFLAGLYWIGYAFLVEAQDFAILMPFAVLGLCGGLAIFFGAATVCARWFWSSSGTRIISLALFFTAFEWLRGNILTGFPWNALGYGLAFNDTFSQGTSLIGIWGYTFVALLLATIPAIVLDRHYKAFNWVLYCTAIALVAALTLYGYARLNTSLTEAETSTQHIRPTVRIVQPNIDQKTIQRGNTNDKALQFQALMALSLANPTPNAAPPALIVWPETAYPYLWEHHPELLADIKTMQQNTSVLVTGVHRKEQGGAAGVKYYNSLYALDPQGRIHSVYDKIHLVPFGEYLPFQDVLESLGIEQLTRLLGGFSVGKQREPLSIAGLPSFTPLICYEAIFPDEILAGQKRPDYLLHITNDGWFGASTGPHQHLHQTKIRAIEHGLPIIRAANTGISAIIDPYGRTIASLALNRHGVVEGTIPNPIDAPPYTQLDELLFYAAMLLGLVIALIGKRYK